MNIRVNFGYGKVFEGSIEDFADYCLDGWRFVDGSIEAAAATGENVSKALGRLLDLLAQKGLLNAREVLMVVGEVAKKEPTFMP